jgi:hemerythrin-like domain-containing protein
MKLNEQLARFRREHDSFLLFLRDFELALNQAGGPEEEKRKAGVARLRSFEPRFAEIRRHCREEERAVEARIRSSVDDEAVERLRADHELFEKLVAEFRLELRRAGSTPPADELFASGRALLGHLRHHIAFEEGVLKQVEDTSAAARLVPGN